MSSVRRGVLTAVATTALLVGAAPGPAAAHGSCDVIPWNPVLRADGMVQGDGQAQCYPETHSTWDVETCLQHRTLPVGDYTFTTCRRVTLTNYTANGITVTKVTDCLDGWWRTRVTAFIGGHAGVTNYSIDTLIVCVTKVHAR